MVWCWCNVASRVVGGVSWGCGGDSGISPAVRGSAGKGRMCYGGTHTHNTYTHTQYIHTHTPRMRAQQRAHGFSERGFRKTTANLRFCALRSFSMDPNRTRHRDTVPAHSTQHTAHSTQHTAQHTAHDTRHTAHSTQHTAQHTNTHSTQHSKPTTRHHEHARV